MIGESQDAHAQVYGQDGQYDSNVGYDDDNKPKFSHELVAGAGAFEGFKLFEDHQRKEGGRHLLHVLRLQNYD